MRFIRAASVLFLTFISTVIAANGQKKEVSLTLGGYFPSHTQASSEDVFAVEGNFAYRIVQRRAAALYVELPVVYSLQSDTTAKTILPGQFFITKSYSALFVTPGVRIKFFPGLRLSPYVLVGGGLAHFDRESSSSVVINTGVSDTTNAGALDAGGGVDWKLSSRISLRGEVRDFYAGSSELIFHGPDSRENQIVAGGGVVFRF